MIFCSTIIPTVARSSLSRAVRSVLDQSFEREDFELIVVNDSGSPLNLEDWQSSPRVTILNTNQRERSIARNTGAAISRGKYLHFLDDDDWLIAGALDAFYGISNTTDAGWIYGDSLLTDRNGIPLIELRPNFSGNCFIQLIAGEWIPLQASLILAEAFFSVGGFHPQLHATQDVDLSRRIALHWNFAKLDKTVATIEMGVDQSRTDYKNAPLYSRLGRESILNEPGIIQRSLESADSAFWKGKIVRAFATSGLWNFTRWKVLIGTSRIIHACVIFLLTLGAIFKRDYWRAIFRSYESISFLMGFQEANLEVRRREL